MTRETNRVFFPSISSLKTRYSPSSSKRASLLAFASACSLLLLDGGVGGCIESPAASSSAAAVGCGVIGGGGGGGPAVDASVLVNPEDPRSEHWRVAIPATRCGRKGILGPMRACSGRQGSLPRGQDEDNVNIATHDCNMCGGARPTRASIPPPLRKQRCPLPTTASIYVRKGCGLNVQKNRL